MNICMCDVGNGLNLFVDNSMMIDFGGDENKLSKHSYHHRCCRYYSTRHVNTFVLSHFHEDHYNGLFLNDFKPRFFNLEYVYYAGLPTIIDNNGNNIGTTFFVCLMAMNHYLLGDKSGLPAADFIERLQQLSENSFNYAPLFKGDYIQHNNVQYEVLWPPRYIEVKSNSDKRTIDSDDEIIVSKVKKGIAAFEKAKKEHPELSELAEKYFSVVAEKYIRENNKYEEEAYKYPNENMKKVDSKLGEAPHRKHIDEKSELPVLVKNANNALRAAANDLCLALKSHDDTLLFMGDLETNQINRVCQMLGKRQFDIFITPHHGTHKGAGMRLLSIKVALSSVGSLKNGYLKNPDLKNILNKYDTYNDGCLYVHNNHFGIDIETCKHTFFKKTEE